MSKETQSRIIVLAMDGNFYGKRKRLTRLAVCDEIIEELEMSQDDLPSGELCDWLLENKPVKEATTKGRQSNKPAANTMAGQAVLNREEFHIMGDGVFIVTAAQNNTTPHNVLKQLEIMATTYQAELLVMPIHYNKNAFSAAVESEEEYFDTAVQKYLLERDVWLGDRVGGVRLAVSANVLPTAKNPVGAARMLNAGEAATIVASPRQDLECLPVMQGQPKRQAWTTGVCTNYNYTESRAGAEAETAHKFGALIVTVENGTAKIRNIMLGSDGTLWDEAMLSGQPVDIVLGDIHAEREDKEITAKTLEWLDGFNVRCIALHDVLHFETKSHHNRKSGNHLYKMAALGKTVKKDLETVINVVNKYADTCESVYMVESNHNSAIDNWLDDMSYNPKLDASDSKLYYLLNWAVCNNIDNGHDFTALQIAMEQCTEHAGLPFIADNIVFGDMDCSEVWNGNEVSQHGHKGQNGSFGSTKLFGKWKMQMITGHTHSPAISGDCYTVGVTASLRQGYNRGGASSWDHANALILPNGVVQMCFINALTF